MSFRAFTACVFEHAHPYIERPGKLQVAPLRLVYPQRRICLLFHLEVLILMTSGYRCRQPEAGLIALHSLATTGLLLDAPDWRHFSLMVQDLKRL